MIGVLSSIEEEATVREFFELFKVPWEFAVEGVKYNLVISTTEQIPDRRPEVLILCSDRPTGLDRKLKLEISKTATTGHLRIENDDLPVYQGLTAFSSDPADHLLSSTCGSSVCRSSWGQTRVIRVGLNLFREVEWLLTRGQPPENAPLATLDKYIDFLRWVIKTEGIPLLEVLPRPVGHRFFACLTHDIDFLSIRDHRFDSTMFGFLYRATLGSGLAALQGKRPFGDVWQNWKATATLPLVMLHLQSDFWQPFDRYLAMEDDVASTFFLIPRKDFSGVDRDGRSNRRRAVGYQVSDVESVLPQLKAAQCEVGLHGLDAWKNTQDACSERARIERSWEEPVKGVRMHWLYYDQSSPGVLEEAGFDYDSTWGYNEAVGFRAGTGQVFKPPTVKHLLELPLHIQDTALFFPSRMGLDEDQAGDICSRLIEHFRAQGGVLTLNWHDRSLAPERLWGRFYARLLSELRSSGAFFMTGSRVSEWFRARRGIRFKTDSSGQVTICSDHELTPPALVRQTEGDGSSKMFHFDGRASSVPQALPVISGARTAADRIKNW